MIHDHSAMSLLTWSTPKWASTATRNRTRQITHVIRFGAFPPPRAIDTSLLRRSNRPGRDGYHRSAGGHLPSVVCLDYDDRYSTLSSSAAGNVGDLVGCIGDGHVGGDC